MESLFVLCLFLAILILFSFVLPIFLVVFYEHKVSKLKDDLDRYHYQDIIYSATSRN